MICKELGWSLDFVEHGISYAKLQMTVADMPRVGKREQDEPITLTDENEKEVFDMIFKGLGGTYK